MKTIFHFAFFTLLFITKTTYSQTGYDVNLLRSGGSSSPFDRGNSVAVDADGNMYVAGNFSGTAEFGALSVTSAGDQDGFIVKYNDQGVEQWVRRVGGTGVDNINGISISGTDVYITGSFNGTANFNTPFSFVNNNLISAGSTDIFLAKFNTSGTFLWTRRAGGTGGDVANSVAASGTDIYITGSFNGTANFNTPSANGSSEITAIGNTDIFIAKFNSSGVVQFQRRAGSTGNDVSRGIVVALNGVYITGEFTGDAHFNTAGIPGTTSLTSVGGSDIFVAKYDFSGIIQWTRRAGGTLNDIGYGIANIGDNVFITGQFFDVANFNTPSATGSNELTSAGSTDGFFARFDANGDFAGARRFGGADVDYGTAICRIGTALYVVGVFDGTANFNQPSASGSNELVTAGNGDIFLARFANTGAFIWAKRAGSSSPDVPSGVTALNSEIYVTGRYATTANFNTPSSGSSNTLVSVGGSTDMFLARYSCIPGAPTGLSAQQFCSANSPTLSSININGVNIKWYNVSTGGSMLNPNTALVNGQTYYASQTTAGCEGTERLAVTVEVFSTIPSPSGATSQNFCGNSTVASLTATGQNIQWFTNATGGSPLSNSTALVSGTTYYASQTIDGCSSTTRLAVNVVVNNISYTPTVISPQNFCSNTSLTLADLDLLPGTNPVWYSTSGTSSPIPASTPLVDGTTYYMRNVINGCESFSAAPIAVNLGPEPNAPTGASPQTFCVANNNAFVLNLTATGSNLNWYNSSTGGSPLNESDALVNGSVYYASQTISNCESSNRLAVTVNVTSVAAPTGNTTQEFCGAPTPTVSQLVASGTNVEWFNSASSSIPLNGTNNLSNGSTYYAQQTITGCPSATRLAVTVTLNSTPLPTGNSTQVLCISSNPTIGNLVANGTSILWYATPTGGSPLAGTTPLVHNTNYYASQTIDGCPSNRLTVNVQLNSIVPGPVAPMSQNFCSGDSPTLASIDATGTNLQWYNAQTGGSTLPLSTPLVNGTAYWVSQTTNCGESNRIGVLVNIYTTPSAPSGNATQYFCSGTPTIADLATTPSATYWYATANGGSPLSTSTALVNGESYFASIENVGCESDRFEVVTVIGTAPAAPSGNATQVFCATAGVIYRVQDLVATGSSINWYYSETGGSPADPLDVLGNGGTYYASQTINGCESTSRFEVTVELISTPAPVGSSVHHFCSQDAPTVDDLEATGTSIVWYDSNTGGTILPGSTPLVNGTLYFASQTLNGCPSENRLGSQANIITVPSPTGNATQEFCISSNPTVNDLFTNESNATWYLSITGGSALATSTPLIDGTIYYASITNSGCESVNRFAVTVDFISESSAPNGLANQSFCAQNNPTINSINVSGTAIEWFTVPTGGSPIATSTPLVNGVTYYAAQNVAGCPSGNRLAVTVAVNPTPSAPTGASNQSFCAGIDPLISELTINGTDIAWYNAATGGSLLSVSSSLVNGTTYYASQTVNGCESTNRLAITVNLTPSPAAPTGTQSQYFCSIDAPTIASLEANGTTINWYENLSSTVVLTTSTPLVDGTIYYATQTVNGCESEDRFQALVIINQTPNAPSGTAAQDFCASATIADLAATGTSIQWYSASSGGNSLASSTTLTNQTNYFASQTVTGCESIDRFEVLVTLTNSPNDAVTVSGEIITAVEPNAQYQWINCEDNQPILGESQQTFVVTETGSYAVQITKDGCTATSECVEIEVLGIEYLEKHSFSIYPNPASNYMFLKGDYSSASSGIKVIDISGKDISNSISTSTLNDEIKINTEALTPGIYYLIVTNNNISERIKFTIHK